MSRKLVLVTKSPEATSALGRALGRLLSGGDIVLLDGPLGAGKSVIARGIGEAVGVRRWRGSPTFNLVYEYQTVPRLYHLDLYRLSPEETEDLGLEEYAGGESVLVVEWADRDPEYLRSLASGRLVRLYLELEDRDSRLIRVKAPLEVIEPLASWAEIP